MKKILLALNFFLTLFLLNAQIAENKLTYKNRSLGFGIIMPENWQLYTSKNNSPEYFKDYFAKKKTENDSPLFMGNDKSLKIFTRCLIEKYAGDLKAYFDLLVIAVASEDIKITSAKYDKKTDTIVWKYVAQKNNLTINFFESIAKQNDTFIRLSFWTLSNIYDKYEPEFIKISENSYFLEKVKLKKVWTARWLNLYHNLPVDDIIEIEKKEKVEQPEDNFTFPFFQVRGDKNTVYLMGSIHLGSKEFYPFPEKIENAFSDCPNIVVEADINSEKMKDAEYLMNLMKITNSKTLKETITSSLYEKLKTEFNRYSIDIEKFNQFKPFFIASILTSYKFLTLGYSEEYGVEKYFLEKSGSKNIIELEGLEEQLKIIDQINGEVLLAYTLLDLDKTEKEIPQLITAWKSNDLSTLEKMFFNDTYHNTIPSVDDYYNTFIYQRNINMANKIKEYLKKDNDYFVIIGTAHYIGKKGILELLKKEGYEVK